MHETIPRYAHGLTVEERIMPIVRGIVDRCLINPCEVKSMGYGMYQLYFWASEEEYDNIAKGIEDAHLADI